MRGDRTSRWLAFGSRVALVGALILFLVTMGQVPGAVVAAPADLDPTFDGDGIMIRDFGGYDSAEAVIVQPDGKIVAAGYVSGDLLMSRYNSDGSFDLGFGSGGSTITNLGSAEDGFHAVALQPDGKIVAAGQTIVSGSYRFVVARYTAAGALDASFGSGGIVVLSYGGSFDNGLGIVPMADGRIVACGTGGPSREFALARFLSNGTLDSTFGSGGQVLTDFGETDACFNLALQPDGKIVTAGTVGPGSRDVALARYNADGTLDSSFGTGGKVTTNVAGADTGVDIELLSDGKILVAGTAGPLTSGNFALLRYNANGTLDGTFGSGGLVVTDIGSSSHDNGEAMAVQSDGKIVVGGNSGSPVAMAFARYNADGSLDASFGTGGKLTVSLGGSFSAMIDLTIQPDGKIIGAGYNQVGSTANLALVRLLGDAVALPPTVTPTFTHTPTVTPTSTVTPTPTPVVTNVSPAADTYVRNGADNTNEGASTFMRVRSSGQNRALVRFDQAAIQAAVNGGTLVSAKLRMTITDNGENWGPSGRTVDAHRVTASWSEGNGWTDGNSPSFRGTGAGATWACASDSNIANQAKDCSGVTEWEMGQPNQPQLHPWVQTATGTVTITSNQTGVVEWDVTADVAAFVSGSAQNYGWLIRKTEEGQNGLVHFGTKESGAPPQLVIVRQ